MMKQDVDKPLTQSVSKLPQHVDPIKLANAGAILEGRVETTTMHRLAEVVYSKVEPALTRLQFGIDSYGQRFLTGSVTVELQLTCQRCNDPVVYQQELAFKLGLIIDESQAVSLPKEYDPLVTHGELISLVGLVEDEILLNLPMIARHETEMCPVELSDFSAPPK